MPKPAMCVDYSSLDALRLKWAHTPSISTDFRVVHMSVIECVHVAIPGSDLQFPIHQYYLHSTALQEARLPESLEWLHSKLDAFFRFKTIQICFKSAHYDLGLSDFVPIRETSEESQRVVYGDHRAVWDHCSPISKKSSKKKIDSVHSIILNTS